jgi:hypothetical protein
MRFFLVGKSSVAALMGRVFHSLGVLASNELVSLSAAKLQGQFVGQTAPLVRNAFRSALGKVLFVDESPGLDPHQNKRSFMKEALDEIVSVLTEPEFKGKLVVILAGYTKEMHQMLSANEGLASRFPDDIVFPSFTVDDSLRLLCTILADKQQYVLDATQIQQDGAVRRAMTDIVVGEAFANGRDVHSIASRIELDLAMQDDADDTSSHVDEVGQPAAQIITPAIVLHTLRTFYRGVSTRAKNSHARDHDRHHHHHHHHGHGHTHGPPSDEFLCESPPTAFQFRTEMAIEVTKNKEDDDDEKKGDGDDSEDEDAPERDPNVDDATWARVQQGLAQRKTERRERAALGQSIQVAETQLRQVLQQGGDSATVQRIRTELELRREQQRQIEKKVKELEDVQTRLKRMGVCSSGFQWMQVDGGYVCSAGGHRVTDAQLEASNVD